jgi:chorismate mutase
MTAMANMEKDKQLVAHTRQRIDELDRAIVRLLNQRAENAALVGSLKQNLDLPVLSRAREKAVLKNIAAANHGPLTDVQLLGIYKRVLRSMRAIQQAALKSEDTPNREAK